MDKKITRRAVLGTAIAALVTGPFVIRAFHRTVELPPDSFLAGLRTRFLPALDFPRKFGIDYDDGNWMPMAGRAESYHPKALARFRALPKDVQETIVETQRRYWQNFAQIDELEFDCTNFSFNEDGTKKTAHGNFEGCVRMKYGYGLEIVGKNAKGEPIHWVFNLDGDISPVAQEFNISSMMQSFFGADKALPSAALVFDHVHSTNAELPKNPYIKAAEGDRYTILSRDRYLQFIKLPPHIEGKLFSGYYYNNRTGMLDYDYNSYVHAEKCGDINKSVIFWNLNSEGIRELRDGDRYFNPVYEDPSIPLPDPSISMTYWKNAEVEKGFFYRSNVLTCGTDTFCGKQRILTSASSGFNSNILEDSTMTINELKETLSWNS